MSGGQGALETAGSVRSGSMRGLLAGEFAGIGLVGAALLVLWGTCDGRGVPAPPGWKVVAAVLGSVWVAIGALGVWRVARLRLLVEPGGLTVVGGFRTERMTWASLAGASTGRAWLGRVLCLRRDDGSSVFVYAVSIASRADAASVALLVDEIERRATGVAAVMQADPLPDLPLAPWTSRAATGPDDGEIVWTPRTSTTFRQVRRRSLLAGGMVWIGLSLSIIVGIELVVPHVRPLLDVAMAVGLAVVVWLGPYVAAFRLTRGAAVSVGAGSIGDRSRFGWRIVDLTQLRGIGVIETVSQAGLIPRTMVLRMVRIVDSDGRRLDLPDECVAGLVAAALRRHLDESVTVTGAARKLLDLPA